MDSPDDAPNTEVNHNPFSSPTGAPNRVQRDSEIAPRPGAADPTNLGEGPGDSDSDLAHWPYRSFPASDTSHSHRVSLGELLRLRPYQIDTDDPARAARIGQLTAPTAAYEQEEAAPDRNPQWRPSTRSVSTYTCAPHDVNSGHEERRASSSSRATRPARDEGAVWGKWMNGGIPNPPVRSEMFRLALVGGFLYLIAGNFDGSCTFRTGESTSPIRPFAHLEVEI